MAWGPNPNTEEELEKLAAVREYIHERFPNASIHDSYDQARLAQVFRIESDSLGGVRDVILLTAFLDEFEARKIGKVLLGWRVAEHLQAAKELEILVTSWGVEERERNS